MNYRILHDDGKQYGPVSPDTLRQWIRDGRAGAQTRVQADGASEWQTLRDLAEFQADLQGSNLPPGRGAANVPLPEAKSSSMAVISLVLGILGFLTVGITALFGLVLGIIALVRIGGSRGRLRGRGVAIAGMVTSGVALLFVPIIAILAAMLLPALAKAKEKAQTISCVNNLKQTGLTARMYAVDNADAFPTANWCDLMMPFIGSTNVLLCPAHPVGDCGYAYNSNLVGKVEGDVSPDTVMFFESDAGWNAVGGEDLMLQQPRHGYVFNVGLADGSVRQVHVSQVESLRWEP